MLYNTIEEIRKKFSNILQMHIKDICSDHTSVYNKSKTGDSTYIRVLSPPRFY